MTKSSQTPARWLIGLLLTLSLILGPQLTVAAAPLAAPARTNLTQITPPPIGGNKNEEAVAEELFDDEEDELAVTDLDRVSDAVVQIEAVGTFVDPSEGVVRNAAGRGSGFIIDPSGLVVTNNHVVTGAAFLKVYVAGETRPRNARVLGVSECSDLAVIDLQGDGYPYLHWSEKPVRVGLEIYAAGFPLGDPEFTLTRGIIAKANADGESNWASVDHVIQHDASTNPGNSGGPIIDADGAVVAIHYAGNNQTNQFFAITAAEAMPVLDELRAGNDIDSIGINGQAVRLGDEVTGIWVASVKSGSPADNVGLRAGDILLSMEGVTLATNDTMTEYCDILRSHTLTDVMSLEVLRLETGEVLAGQLNGRPLELSFSLAQTLEENGEEPRGTTGGPVSYEDYVTITDDSGILSLSVPAAWDDVDGGPWISNDEEIGVRLMASSDLDEMLSSWGTSGVFFGASAELGTDPAKLLDGIDYSNSCIHEGREEYPEGNYVGFYDIWSTCGDAESTAAVVALAPATEDYLLLLEIYVNTEADLEALDQILGSFLVTLEEPSAPTDDPTTTVDTSDLLYTYQLLEEPALSGLFPEEYGEVLSGEWEVDGEVYGSTLAVAPSIDDYNNSWSSPGIYVRTATDLSEDIDIDEWLDSVDLSEYCERDDRVKHSHSAGGMTYSGAYDIWLNCGETENAFVFLVAVSEPAEQLILLNFQVIDEADVEAFGVLMDSFYVPSETASTAEPLEFEYVTLSDESGTISVRLPADWQDTRRGTWTEDDEVIGFSINASSDLAAYNETWTTPGMFFGATANMPAGMDAEEMLNQWDYSNSCLEVERFDYDDSVYAGFYDIYFDCDGDNNIFVVLAAQPKEVDGIWVLIQVSIPAGTSVEPFEQILASFAVEQPDNLLNGVAEPSADADVTATVIAPTLNIRNGPGTNYNRVGALGNGDEVLVTGQVNNCAWLQVATPDNSTGWISGGAQYTRINGDCANVATVAAPPPPANTNTGTSGNPGSSNAASGQACILFRNNLGAELNITFTRSGDNWNRTFKVPGNRQQRECFDPGRYTFTVDAPPPWSSFNDAIELSAGDNFPYDVNPAN